MKTVLLGVIVIFTKITMGLPNSAFITGEALLVSCQASGHELYYNCVVKPAVKPDDVAACTTLKTTYLICLAKLNLPYSLIPSTDPDPYAYSAFTPCRFEIGHAILYDICPNIP